MSSIGKSYKVQQGNSKVEKSWDPARFDVNNDGTSVQLSVSEVYHGPIQLKLLGDTVTFHSYELGRLGNKRGPPVGSMTVKLISNVLEIKYSMIDHMTLYHDDANSEAHLVVVLASQGVQELSAQLQTYERLKEIAPNAAHINEAHITKAISPKAAVQMYQSQWCRIFTIISIKLYHELDKLHCLLFVICADDMPSVAKFPEAVRTRIHPTRERMIARRKEKATFKKPYMGATQAKFDSFFSYTGSTPSERVLWVKNLVQYGLRRSDSNSSSSFQLDTRFLGQNSVIENQAWVLENRVFVVKVAPACLSLKPHQPSFHMMGAPVGNVMNSYPEPLASRKRSANPSDSHQELRNGIGSSMSSSPGQKKPKHEIGDGSAQMFLTPIPKDSNELSTAISTRFTDEDEENSKGWAAARVCGVNNEFSKPGPSTETMLAGNRVSCMKARKVKKVVTIALDDDDHENSPHGSSHSSGDSTTSQQTSNGRRPMNQNRQPSATLQSTLVKFPPEGRDMVTVHFDDMRVLAHDEMLNDTIIEFYIKYIFHRLCSPKLSNRCHIYSTYFFTKLVDKLPTAAFKRGERAATVRFEWVGKNYRTLRSWTKKTNIFDKDFLVFPINDDVHWFVVIVINPKNAIVPEDQMGEVIRKREAQTTPATYMIVLDSLTDKNDPRRSTTCDMIRDYLEYELEDKKEKFGIKGSFDRSKMGVITPRSLPRQTNYVDCGLYLLSFVEAFFTNMPDLSNLSEGVRWADWYPHFEMSVMRFMREKVIRRLRSVVKPEAWKQFMEFEQELLKGIPARRGISSPTEEAIVENARRPRRHSDCIGVSEKVHLRLRCTSEPPDPKNCPPPSSAAQLLEQKS